MLPVSPIIWIKSLRGIALTPELQTRLLIVQFLFFIFLASPFDQLLAMVARFVLLCQQAEVSQLPLCVHVLSPAIQLC